MENSKEKIIKILNENLDLEERYEDYKNNLVINYIIGIEESARMIIDEIISNLEKENEELKGEISRLKNRYEWNNVKDRLPEKETTDHHEMYFCKIDFYGEERVVPLAFVGGSFYTQIGGGSWGSDWSKFVISWKYVGDFLV